MRTRDEAFRHSLADLSGRFSFRPDGKILRGEGYMRGGESDAS
jgi:hypothetical protein